MEYLNKLIQELPSTTPVKKPIYASNDVNGMILLHSAAGEFIHRDTLDLVQHFAKGYFAPHAPCVTWNPSGRPMKFDSCGESTSLQAEAAAYEDLLQSMQEVARKAHALNRHFGHAIGMPGECFADVGNGLDDLMDGVEQSIRYIDSQIGDES